MSLALIFAMLAAQLQFGQPSPGTSQLHGWISEPDGRPIPGARVTVTCNRVPIEVQPIAAPDRAHSTTADTDTAVDGRYEINNLPAGTCSVVATKVGYVVSGPNGPLGVVTTLVPLAEGAATERNLEMTRGADVSGRVVNGHGEPVVRAAVLL